MERPVRRERAAAERQESRQKSRSSRHHQSRPNDASRARTATPTHQASATAKLPEDPVAKPLNGDIDYVHRWLAHTDSPINHDLDPPRGDEFQPQEGHSTHLKTEHRRYPQVQEAELPPLKRRQRHSSSDSSILASPIRPHSHHARENDETIEARHETANGSRKRKRTKVSEHSSSDTSENASLPKETFERRARHKTREDKYEPKTSKKSRKDDTERKSRRKEKKKDGKRTATKSGEELMGKFSSKSIAQDRLTIRPQQGPGLFNNGRASSPARRKGLSDLAFSEMNFLQHSSRQTHAEQKSRVNTKSRDKERRKVLRAQEEIDEFFKPNRKPLEEGHSNRPKRASSIKSTEKSSIYVRQIEKENRQQSYSDIRSLDTRERPLVRLRQPDLSSDRLSTRQSDPPVISQPRYHCRPTSRTSEKATTIISWSETQLSPSAESNRPIVNRVQVSLSPTPTSVRRSLEDTGIFRYTGIDGGAGRHQRTRRVSPPEFSPSSVELAQRTADRMNGTQQNSVNFNDDLHPQSLSQGLRSPKNQRKSSRVEKRATINAPRSEVNDAQEVGTTRTRVIVEQFDPARGWHETSQPTSRCISSDPHQEAKRTPVDRQELGLAARIRRPSTTLPVSRVPVRETEQEPRPMNANEGRNNNVSATHNAPVFASVEELNSPHARLESNAHYDQKPKADTNSNRDLHRLDHNASGRPLEASRELPVVDPVETFSRRGDMLSYLGLPVRGTWEPLQIDHNRQSTPVIDRPPPHFLHQIQQEMPILNTDNRVHHAVTDYEIYDVPEEDEDDMEFLSKSKHHEVYGNLEIVVQDPAAYGPYMDVQQIDNNHYGSLDRPNAEIPAFDAYGDLEPDYEEGLYQEIIYEDDAIAGNNFLGQELEAPFQVGMDYQNYDTEAVQEMQGFWRPRTQY